MPRISGVDIPNEKRIEIALTYIYGIGQSRAREILALAGLDPSIKAKDLTEDQVVKIREAIEKLGFPLEGELKRIISQNIRRLTDIKCYRGIRHLKRLPVRGQRTRTNARTKRGKKQTIGGMKRVLQKT